MVKLFFLAFMQVGLVAANTYLISKMYYPAILACSFLISLIWSWNVKRVVFGGIVDRIVYAAGASIGGVSGVFLSQLIFRITV